MLTELQGKEFLLIHPLLYGALWIRTQLTQQEGQTQLNAVIPSQKVLCRSSGPTHAWWWLSANEHESCQLWSSGQNFSFLI